MKKLKYAKETSKYSWKLWEKALAAGMILAMLFSFTGFAGQCSDLSGRVLRLHILANSDSHEDQALKLKVRDRILKESAGLLDGVTTLSEAEERVQNKIPQLEQAASEEIHRQGYSYPVSMELSPSFFNTRVYGKITLPAGTYNALQVRIGTAKGHNWWCVLFPALCLPAAQDPAKLQDVISADQMKIVSGKSETYEIKFKVLEWVQEVQQWVNQKSGDDTAQNGRPVSSQVESSSVGN